jgi:hypothetical protein
VTSHVQIAAGASFEAFEGAHLHLRDGATRVALELGDRQGRYLGLGARSTAITVNDLVIESLIDE